MTVIIGFGFKKFVVFTLFFVFALAFFIFIIPTAFGQTSNVPQVTPPTGSAPITNIEQGLGLFRQLLTWFATAFWIAAALFVFYAAFIYLTAAGDESRVKKAHSQLLYAVIAIAIGLMAYGMPTFVSSFLGSGEGGGGGGGGGNNSGCPQGYQLPNGGCGI